MEREKRMETVKIDGDRLYEKLKGISEKSDEPLTSMSEKLGKNRTYINCLKFYKDIREPVYALICRTFGIEYEEFLHRDPKPVPEKPAALKTQEGPALKSGYDMTLRVSPNKVFLALWFDGVEVSHAYSRVKGATELDLVQAISYASHMIYKNVEQATLEGGN